MITAHTDVVGSLLRPVGLRKARDDWVAGRLSHAQLKSIEDRGGAVYATSVGLTVKWFPDRRGLAVGLTAAGYGAGTALTIIAIRHVIETCSP
jgi:hypothetical protein